MLILLTPFIALVYVKSISWPVCLDPNDSSCKGPEQYRKFVTIVWCALASLAVTSGSLGTIVSFFLRQTRTDFINYARDSAAGTQDTQDIYVGTREIFILVFFGSTFGFIFLFLFIGGFVQGDLFPSVKVDSWMSVNVRIDAWAKVFIWCFVAGFSERLIPDLLDTLVSRASPRSTDNAPKTLQEQSGGNEISAVPAYSETIPIS
jgi:hypothetical protein